MSFMEEIRKIPPVTRFLCGSSLAVSLPVMLQIISPYKLVFVKEFVTRNYEVWRVYTSFFLGGSGLNYLFDFIMLYRNSDQLESSYFAGRSADYAWQLILAAASILALNIPLGSFVHTRPLLLSLVYLTSKLAPPGTQTSLFGLLTLPVAYFPYALLTLDLLMGGPGAAAQSVTGLVTGHLWWYTVYHTRTLERWARAPVWLKTWLDGPTAGGAGGAGRNVGGAGSGVHVIPPRRLREEASTTTGGHTWGSGQRLGDA